MPSEDTERSPGAKLTFAVIVAALLIIPLFTVYLLIYDRQNQSQTARTSIAAGWGGAQVLTGPNLAIPYQTTSTETVTENGKPVTRTATVWRELTLLPQTVDMTTAIAPEVRKRSIYEAVVYGAHHAGRARFVLPADLARMGIDTGSLAVDRAELRFGIVDPRGLYGPPPRVTVNGVQRPLQPGKGTPETGGAGFYTWVDASALRTAPITADFAFDLRGNESLALAPQAGDTRWTVTSPWRNPSFTGGFLPAARDVSASGFRAQYRVGNLALGREMAAVGDPPGAGDRILSDRNVPDAVQARIGLVTPVDLYDQVNRSVKYGFLFIGFTFMAFLMFDVVGGVRVSAVEYLLVGAGLVLFFVMLLAFAEVIGFGWAYLVAAGAIIALLTAYSAAVLGSRQRAGFIGALLIGLYAVLYVLLSLEAYSLLIGSLLTFAALAAIMYLTRKVDWGRRRPSPARP